jgi:elongation factor G
MCWIAPGYADFHQRRTWALRVSDLAVVVIHANHGLGVGTDAVWKYAASLNIPKIIVVNAFDKEETNFEKGAGTNPRAFW